MTELDLVEMITDPDMGGCRFVYCRATERVNDKGRSEKEQNWHSADGNIQPAPGKERELLEEGERQKAAIMIFTPEPLTAGEDATKADRIFHDGALYRVALAEPWQLHAGFTRAIAVYEHKLLMSEAEWESLKHEEARH